jgi:hypothetical protein
MTQDQASRDLWCYVEGDIAAFKVTTPLNVDVDRLKKLIRGERQHVVLRDVDAADLVLWKVCEKKKSNINLRADVGLEAHSTSSTITLSLYLRTYSIAPHTIPRLCRGIG